MDGWKYTIVPVEGDDTAVFRAYQKLIEWSVQDAQAQNATKKPQHIEAQSDQEQTIQTSKSA